MTLFTYVIGGTAGLIAAGFVFWYMSTPEPDSGSKMSTMWAEAKECCIEYLTKEGRQGTRR